MSLFCYGAVSGTLPVCATPKLSLVDKDALALHDAASTEKAYGSSFKELDG